MIRRLLWLLIGLYALSAVVWFWRLDFDQKVVTSVLELLPGDPANPEASMARSLASGKQARTMLVVITGGSEPSRAEALKALRAHLEESGHYQHIESPASSEQTRGIGRTLFDHRLRVLFPRWLDRMTAQSESADASLVQVAARQTVEQLNAFLGDPASLYYEDQVVADPLLLVPGALNDLAAGAELLRQEADDATVLLLQLKASPFDSKAQIDVIANLQSAMTQVESAHGVKVQWTGVNRFAVANERDIRREVFILNLLSIGGVLLVAWLLVRRIRLVPKIFLVVAASLTSAWMVTLSVFTQVHVLSIVVGSVLAGVAIDYGIHAFLQANEDKERGWRAVVRPLGISCFTTAGGFLTLTWSELPMLRQTGLFVASGLLSACAFALVFVFLLPGGYDTPVSALRRGKPGGARTRLLMWLVALAIGTGAVHLDWSDSVRELEYPQPELYANETRVRELAGWNAGNNLFLTWGDNVADIVSHQRAWTEDQDMRDAFFSPTLWLPTEEEYRRGVRFVRDDLKAFEQALRKELAAQDYDPSAFDPFFDALREWENASAAAASYEASMASFLDALPGAMALMVQTDTEPRWIATSVDAERSVSADPSLQTIRMQNLETLNEAFATYRARAAGISFLAAGVMLGAIVLFYGVRPGLRIVAVPVVSVCAVLGALGWLGQSGNLFHLLGAFLGACIAFDYAVFREHARRNENPFPKSIIVSAATTAIAFGVLSFSAIPAARALGLTVAAVTILACLIARFGFAPTACVRNATHNSSS